MSLLLLQQNHYPKLFLICKKFGISQILAMWEFNLNSVFLLTLNSMR